MARAQIIDSIRAAASLVGGTRRDYDPLLELSAQAGFVLLGEATHGSHEGYRERGRITQRLIAEQAFNGVVVEADWPDADRVNRWAQDRSDDGDAEEALGGFRRFPTWMWRNTAVVEFLSWLRARNESSGRAPVLFHGMDLYSLYASMDAVVKYLARHDPEAAARARARYACFEMPGREDGRQAYGHAAHLGTIEPCEQQAVQQLLELQRRASRELDPELFSAEQNARLARNAEVYYRAMFGSRISTWNLRDRHMVETLEAVAAFLQRRDGYSRIVVWAHNSHLGDARAGHRRRLSTRHRAVLALLRGAPGVTVRRRGAHRSDARGGAPRTLTVVDSGAAGDVPLRAVRAYTSGRVRRRGRREGERRLPGPRPAAAGSRRVRQRRRVPGGCRRQRSEPGRRGGASRREGRAGGARRPRRARRCGAGEAPRRECRDAFRHPRSRAAHRRRSLPGGGVRREADPFRCRRKCAADFGVRARGRGGDRLRPRRPLSARGPSRRGGGSGPPGAQREMRGRPRSRTSRPAA